MVSIEHLQQNGVEPIASQFAIDHARARDKQLRDARRRSNLKWWKDLTGVIDSEILIGSDLIENTSVVLSQEESDEVGNDNQQSDFLAQFRDSDAYRVIKTQLYEYLDASNTPEERNKALREFAGAGFEQVAYQYFSDDYGSEARVLTPEETDKYFLSLYPEHEVRKYPFGKIGLTGVIVPDSLVVVGDNVVFQTEFSLHREEEYYHRKYEGFLHNKYARATGTSFDNAALIFGVPESFPKNIEQSLLESYGDQVGFYEVPFTHKDYYEEVLRPLSSLWSSEK